MTRPVLADRMAAVFWIGLVFLVGALLVAIALAIAIGAHIIAFSKDDADGRRRPP